MHAHTNDYPFYLSESLLFSSYWLLIFPIYLGVEILYNLLFGKYHWVSSLAMCIASVVALMLFFAIVVYTVSFLLFDHTYQLSQVMRYVMSNNLMYSMLIICLIHSVRMYISRHEMQSSSCIKTIAVVAGGLTQVISVDDIECIKSESPYVLLVTETKRLLHNATLKGLENQLGNSFVRVHKSAIINIAKVASYKSRFNGDYDLVMCNSEQVRVSRNFAKKFKSKIKTSA